MILGCTVALQCNPTCVLGEFDLKNAHKHCSRGLIWEELMNDVYFHFLIQIFLCMYGDTCTPQWYFGTTTLQAYTGSVMDYDMERQLRMCSSISYPPSSTELLSRS